MLQLNQYHAPSCPQLQLEKKKELMEQTSKEDASWDATSSNHLQHALFYHSGYILWVQKQVYPQQGGQLQG